MKLLTATTDSIEVITSAAGSVDMRCDYMDATNADPPVVKGSTSGRAHAASVTTATTTTLVSGAASTLRNVKSIFVRNKSSSVSNDITVRYNANGTTIEEVKYTLPPGATLQWSSETGLWDVFSPSQQKAANAALASQTGFSADTYLTGSNIAIPLGGPTAGMTYRLVFDVTKTAAGTAAAVLSIRYGTAGSTADTARAQLTWGAQTAAIDAGIITVLATFRAVGSGTTAVIQAIGQLVNNLASTGLSSATKAVMNTGSGFDSTPANSIIGASWNGGASAAHTIQLVKAQLIA